MAVCGDRRDPARVRRRRLRAGRPGGGAAGWLRCAAVAAVTAGAVVLPAELASAHITVVASTTTGGSDEVSLAFRVPTESATASTTKVAITLPSTQPFADVSVRPVPGWTVAVIRARLATPVVDDAGTTLTRGPHVITWTATRGAAVAPGEYQEFDVYAGPLPLSGTETFTAVQTYSDGSVVRWDQIPRAGADEPAHPAPSFVITPAGDPAGVDSTARVLAGVGIGVGILGLAAGVGGVVLARRARRTRRSGGSGRSGSTGPHSSGGSGRRSTGGGPPDAGASGPPSAGAAPPATGTP